MHFNVYDVFYSVYMYSHQHVSAAIAAIFRVVLLLQEYKVPMQLTVSPHSVTIKNYYNFS
jgi:hypothetical protein